MVVLQDDGVTTLGTLLSPKKPRVKHREQKPRSRRQQMEYRWLERWNELLSWTVIFQHYHSLHLLGPRGYLEVEVLHGAECACEPLQAARGRHHTVVLPSLVLGHSAVNIVSTF